MRCDEIGVKVSRQEFVDFLNSIKGGQFFHIRGYKAQNSEGVVSDDPENASEITDQWVRFGIKYANFRSRDIAMLQAVLTGDKKFTVLVTHGVWVPNDMLNSMFDDNSPHAVWVRAEYVRSLTLNGKPSKIRLDGHMDLLDTVRFSNRKSADKTQVTVSYQLPSTHPLVIAAIGGADLQGTLLQGLINPTPSKADYDNQAKSFYSLDRADGKKMWYLRDVAVVGKVVRRVGTRKFTASLPINAIKNAIEDQFLLRGKYRQFILNEGNFDAITIEGQSILVDGMDEQFYFALPEDVRTLAESIAICEVAIS